MDINFASFIGECLHSKYDYTTYDFHHLCAFIGDETFTAENEFRKKNMPVAHHAEVSVIRKILKKYGSSLKRPLMCDVVVVRVSRKGKIGESRPCYHCIKTMQSVSSFIKIRNVYYSTPDGRLEKEKLSEMLDSPKTRVSTGWRYRTGKSKIVQKLE